MGRSCTMAIISRHMLCYAFSRKNGGYTQMSGKLYISSFALLLILLPATLMAGGILVPDPTPFSENSNVRKRVKDECRLETKLPTFVQSYATKLGVEITLTDQPLSIKSSGKVLLLEITGVVAPGGGAWSGPKTVSVAGKLYDNGKLVGDFTGSRYSTGGVFGGYKGTCSIAGRCVKTLGKDIAEWLRQPSSSAHLGDG